MNDEENKSYNYYDSLTRSLIQHESELINHRLTWMWALQGLLVTAVGLLWKYSWLAVFLICIVGLFSCLSLWYNLHLSHRAIGNIHNYWNKNVKPNLSEQHPPLVGLTREQSWFDLLQPWRILPPVMFFMWVGIILITIY